MRRFKNRSKFTAHDIQLWSVMLKALIPDDIIEKGIREIVGRPTRRV